MPSCSVLSRQCNLGKLVLKANEGTVHHRREPGKATWDALMSQKQPVNFQLLGYTTASWIVLMDSHGDKLDCCEVDTQRQKSEGSVKQTGKHNLELLEAD